jgi:hypothetical protein
MDIHSQMFIFINLSFDRRDTRASKVLRVHLGLVEMHVSTERWSGHLRLSQKKKKKL